MLGIMSTDHGVTGSLPSGPKENPEVLRVKQADYIVIAKVAQEVAQSKLDNGNRIIIKASNQDLSNQAKSLVLESLKRVDQIDRFSSSINTF